MSVGKTIKIFRASRGLKQKDLADSIKIKVQYLSAIENEKREPSLSLLRRISEFFKIPISLFFWDKEESDSGEDSSSLEKIKKLIFEIALNPPSDAKQKK